jgi:HlyD family secretion protein
MADTRVGSPVTGMVLELSAVLGTVISSPTNDVAGGTVILKIANLDTVQVSALVDETDVGKIQPAMTVTITVDAFPNRTFNGKVLKIEPQAQVTQNVTMFPVQVNIMNPDHVLKPGMNTEVQIHIAQRQGVLAVPNAALRTSRDIASAATVLGLDSVAVQQQIATQSPPDSGTTGGRYVVFASRSGQIVPVPITTGLTDQDYVEVLSGVTARDTIIMLVSAGGK